MLNRVLVTFFALFVSTQIFCPVKLALVTAKGPVIFSSSIANSLSVFSHPSQQRD